MSSRIHRALVCLVSLASPAAAQTILQVPGDYATIQAAIVAAADGDTVLVAPGTYLERINFLGKAITIESAAGAAATVIDGSPGGTVVSFGVGLTPVEGPDSILRGFTVTGGTSLFDGGGITAKRGATPLIQACIVSGNACVYAGGGVKGPAILEDCTIEYNTSEDRGGGFAGGPTLRRCLVRRNFAEYYGAAGEGGSGTRLENCTLADNEILDPLGGGGGISGEATLMNCILWNGRGELSPLAATASYCLVQGGFPGTGNVSGDPLFRNAHPLVGDYRLLPGSPCIDTGDPAAPLDPDGTRADIGAFAFTHATASVVNGSGTNPLLLAALTPPAIGTTWKATIQASLVPHTIRSGFLVRTGLDPIPRMTVVGEFLLTGTLLGGVHQPSNGTRDSLSLPIPANTALLGLRVYAQGFVITGPIGPGAVRLGNGLELLLGE